MKIFSPNFYKEGPGVEKDEPQKEGLSLFFELFITRFWDMLKLNVLFILYSIPIVTIGPAFGAITSVTIAMIQRKHVYIFSDFHKAFKSNWKQSLICGLINLIALFLLYSSIFFYFNLTQNNPLIYVVLFFTIVITTLFCFAILYMYPLITTVSLSIKDIYKNSILLGIICLKNTLLAAFACSIVLAINILFFPLSLLLCFFLTFSFLSFIVSFAAWSGIKKYVIK